MPSMQNKEKDYRYLDPDFNYTNRNGVLHNLANIHDENVLLVFESLKVAKRVEELLENPIKIKESNVSDGEKNVLIIDTKTGGGMMFRYQYGNNLGSVGLELNEEGDIISYEEYYPFGGTSYYAHDNAIDVPKKRYRYCGKEQDEESGLYYYSARYYLPWLCRLGSVDPKALEYVHQSSFVYADNNPIVKYDYNGEGTEKETEVEPPVKKGDVFIADDGEEFVVSFDEVEIVDELPVASTEFEFSDLNSTNNKEFKQKFNFPRFVETIEEPINDLATSNIADSKEYPTNEIAENPNPTPMKPLPTKEVDNSANRISSTEPTIGSLAAEALKYAADKSADYKPKLNYRGMAKMEAHGAQFLKGLAKFFKRLGVLGTGIATGISWHNIRNDVNRGQTPSVHDVMDLTFGLIGITAFTIIALSALVTVAPVILTVASVLIC
jgi:RHS repeat-associated protein